MNGHWTDRLPELGDSFQRRAKALMELYVEAHRLHVAAQTEEAQLFSDIEKSGCWTRKEIELAMHPYKAKKSGGASR